MERKEGFFGKFGGCHVPEAISRRFGKVAEEFKKAIEDDSFVNEYLSLLKNYSGRPTPLTYAKRLSEDLGCRIYLKREDLNHTGSHKINNSLGQILLASRMGAREIVAETGAGQHGVATATASALLGMKCKIFMGQRDVERQAVNVKKIRMLGAEVVSVEEGTASLKEAVDKAIEYYGEHEDVYYLLGSAVGPHPFPMMVRYFQEVIGREARKQILENEGTLPDAVVACIGGGSNAIGIFSGFMDDENVALFGAEGGGSEEGTAATLSCGIPKLFQGAYSYCLCDEEGEPISSYSISSGLNYPGIGPEHAFLKESGRAEYLPVGDEEAVDALKLLSRTEGIIPALESSHAVALAKKLFAGSGKVVVVNLSGRGDKDLDIIP